MAGDGTEMPSVPTASTAIRGRAPWLRGVACVAMLPLVGFIGHAGNSLWGEWRSLRQDQVLERNSAVVGYLNITPNPFLASAPDDWFHDEGDVSLLWAGWKDNEHRWFRFGRGDLDGRGFSKPIGRDAIQAIDVPVYERDGGPRWGRVPPEARVGGFDGEWGSVAYPIRVLDKVEVVNEQVGNRPVLVAFTPFGESISVYEATLDGGRVTMGHSGYFRGHQPVLYDRGTQSLWSESGEAMVAVAGPRKGATLKRIARLDVVAWGDWMAKHPEGRLLIGADRSKPLPTN